LGEGPSPQCKTSKRYTIYNIQITNTVHFNVHCVGYLYIVDLINEREMEYIRRLQVIVQGLEHGQPDAGDTGKW
jgi:hypothetical protein